MRGLAQATVIWVVCIVGSHAITLPWKAAPPNVTHWFKPANGVLGDAVQSGLALARLQAADEQQFVSDVAGDVATAKQRLASVLPPKNGTWPLPASKGAAVDSLLAPTYPGVVNRSDTSLTLAWSPPAAAAALGAVGGAYGAVCVSAGAPCRAAAVGAAPPAGAGATTATVTGLPPATALTCYAYTDIPLKLKAGTKRVCSDAAAGTTRPPRPALSTTFIALTSLGFRAYFPGSAPAAASGRRRLTQETKVGDAVLTVKCVAAGGTCDAVGVGMPSPTTTPANVLVSDLSPLTRFTCFAIATAPDGTVACSDPEDAFTGVSPTAPRDLTALTVTSTSIAFMWLPPLVPGAPSAQMGVLCAQPGTSCAAALAGATVGSIPILLPNVTQTRVTGLPAYTSLVCWAVSSNAATLGNALCSPAVSVMTAAVPPSPPVNLTATPLSTTAVSLSWAPGANPGVPVATQGGVCVAYGGACTDPPVGVAPAPAAGAANATVTGLTPGTRFACFATAVNVAMAGPVCSMGVVVQTLQVPGAPTGLAAVAVTASTIALTWALPTVAGVPLATTAAVCVASGAACTAPPLGTALAPAVGQTASVIAGLPAGVAVSCYAVATNSQGSTCSSGVSVTTLAPPTPPRDLALVSPPGQYSLSFTWTVPAYVGVPPAALTVLCVAAGQPCTAPPTGASPPAAVGQTAGAVQGLQPNTSYSCYATAANDVSPTPVCSSAVSAFTATQATLINIPPGPPTAVAAVPLGPTSVAVSWAPTYPGSPAATYDALCVALNSPCTAAPAGSGPVGGTLSANITGLTGGTAYTCYARAVNSATPNPVCSTGVLVSTWTVPGPPTALTLMSVNDTVATVAWTLPAQPGLPPATIAAKAVVSGALCSAPAVGVATAGAVGATQASISGLAPRTALWVYAIATNAVGTACSLPLAVDTWGAPGPPASITATPLTTTSVTVSWGAASPAGVPTPTTYGPLCVAAGQPCTAPPIATGAPSTTAPASATVGGPAMTGASLYTCYVLTSNAASATPACSAGANVTTFSLPGPPGAPNATSITGSSVTAFWNATLMPAGDPAPGLGLTCISGANATCAVPGDGTAPAPAVGATTATVTGLLGGTEYSCFVYALSAATSPATTVCGPRTLVKTWLAPGPPTNVSLAIDAGSEIKLQWALPSTIGEPAAAVGAICVSRGAPCTATQVGTPDAPAVGATQGAVNGLSPNTVVTCYAVAYNSAAPAGVCSVGVDVTTGTFAPSGLTLTSAAVNSLSFAWTIAPQPPPDGGYSVNCGQSGATCLDVVSLPFTSQTMPGFPGLPPVADPALSSGTVQLLGAGSTYTCFAFWNSTTGRYCSNAVTASTQPGPPPAVERLDVGADYDARTGTFFWPAPLPRPSPFFVTAACFAQNTGPLDNLVPDFATRPVCINPACWVFGACGSQITTCFKNVSNLFAQPSAAPAVVPTSSSLAMIFLQRALSAVASGVPQQYLACYAYSISTVGLGFAVSPLGRVVDPSTGDALRRPLRGQLPSPSCGRPWWSDYDFSQPQPNPIYWTINWLPAASCGWNYGFPGGQIASRTVRGTLGIDANRYSPEMGTTCPAQPAWYNGQCRYAFVCSGILAEYCSWTSTSNTFGTYFSAAVCTFPDNPGDVLLCGNRG